MDEPVPASSFRPARVEFLGRTDRMRPEQYAANGRLAGYLIGEGFSPHLYYREPSENDLSGRVEVITMFLDVTSASAELDTVAWAAINAASSWAIERIGLDYPNEGLEPERGQNFVSATFHAADGVFLAGADLTANGGRYYRRLHPRLKGG